MADFHPQVLSATEAAKCGLPRLVKDVESGEDVAVEDGDRPSRRWSA